MWNKISPINKIIIRVAIFFVVTLFIVAGLTSLFTYLLVK